MDEPHGDWPESGVLIRWLGGGVAELRSPRRDLLYVDAWFWSNTGWEAFDAARPAAYASASGFADHVAGAGAAAVGVLVTHDHRDHAGDLFEALQALRDADVRAQVVMQSDLARAGMVDEFRQAGLDPAEVVVTAGNGVNIGGRVSLGSAQITAVPAVHSTLHGHPAIGYVVVVGGASVYCSGDTDVFGDMRLLAQRYRPDVGLLCIGGGPFTMDAEGAALATEMLGCADVVPIHYAHNPNVDGPEAGQRFEAAVHRRGQARVHVLRPGETAAVGGRPPD